LEELLWHNESVMGYLNNLERIWRSLQNELSIPGMSIAIVDSRGILSSAGYGYASLDEQIPASENTPYCIASLTKPFAATLLMLLFESGRLNLDDEIARILQNTSIPFDQNTILDGFSALCPKILGVRGGSSSQHASYWSDYHCEKAQITVRHHLTHTAEGIPGESFHYNGELYWLLTYVIEEISGKNFENYLYQELVHPLGMKCTIPCHNQNRYQEIMTTMAKPYGVKGTDNPTLSSTPKPSVNASTGMISNVLDLATFSIALDQDKLLLPKTKDLMFTPTFSSQGKTLPYGLGWFIQTYRGVKIIWHYGLLPDAYSSLIIKIPSADRILIMLANCDRLSSPFNLDRGDILASPFAKTFITEVLGS
jgi:CubicO group peptidase (beta-lactamase class C family)